AAGDRVGGGGASPPPPPPPPPSRFIATTLLVLSSFLFSASAQANSHYTDDDFVTKWLIPAGSDMDRTLTFPSEGIDTDIDIDTLDCGANLVLPVILPVMVSGFPTCIYREPGTYIVKSSNTITRFNLGANDETRGNAAKLIDVMQWGTANWTSMETAFTGAMNMRMSATDAPRLGGVTSMLGMFFNANVFDGNISNWEVGNVEIMRTMFSGAIVFNQDISGWVVSSVTDMGSMFSFAEKFNQDITGWDVSNVTNMGSMFNSAFVFNQDISVWDVSSITEGIISDMFALTGDFEQNLGRWFVTAQTAVAVATPIRLVAQNTLLTGSYALVEGDGDTNNDLFTLTNTGVLSLEADPTTRTYSLRIGISSTVFGNDNQSENEVAIRVTFRDSDEGTRVYDIEVPLNLGLTAEAVAAAETQILNAILPQLLRATAKITVDNISNRIDQAFASSPADTDASLNLGGSSSLQELINNNARTTLQDGLNIKQMFNNSSFLIPLNVAGDNNYGINNITLWGSGDYLSLEDDVSAVDWEGEVIGGSVGIDARLNQNLIAGAALSYSEGD
ncbi:MAG: DUF285 domain-containing protein, partial [Methylococcales symbiont of Hymedesmia sp. n. MRB-2018]